MKKHLILLFISFSGLIFAQTDSLDRLKVIQSINNPKKKLMIGGFLSYGYVKLYNPPPGSLSYIYIIAGIGKIGFNISPKFMLRTHFAYGKIHNFYGDFYPKEIGLSLRYSPPKMQYLSNIYKVFNRKYRFVFKGFTEVEYLRLNGKLVNDNNATLVFSDKLEYYRIRSAIGGAVRICSNFYYTSALTLSYNPFEYRRKVSIFNNAGFEYHF